MAALLIGEAVVSWLAALVMMLVLIPLLQADLAMADDPGAASAVAAGFAVAGALAGAVALN
jgi:hypothetical protein